MHAMVAGKDAINAAKKNIDIDNLEDIRDEIADQMADQEEVTDFFKVAAEEGQDELMDELDEMLA